MENKKEGINVLSLFDGISCGQVALKRLGIKINNYYASEIKDIAIKVTMEQHPNTIQIGDVNNVRYKDGVLYTEKGEFFVGEIDLLIGGSPCQDFSMAGGFYKDKENYGLNGLKSKLFYEYLRLLRQVNPKYFLLENVNMKGDSEKNLNNYLGVNGIHINSSLVSFQNRPRIYWSNIKNITQPSDKNISFQDYKDIDFEYCDEFKLPKTPSRERMWNNGVKTKGVYSCKNVTNEKKIGCLTRKQDRCPNSGLVRHGDWCRFLTRRELELAQTLPIGYTNSLSYNQMQDVVGDGWTIDVIAHILKNMDIAQ